jgi:hypothetical protein
MTSTIPPTSPPTSPPACPTPGSRPFARLLPPTLLGGLLLFLLPLFPGEWGGGAGGVAAVSAQQAPEGLRFQFIPSLGWYFPSRLLYRSDYPPARARMNRALVVGMGVEMEPPSIPLAVRVGLERADWFHTRLVGTIPGDGFQETLTFRYRVPTAVTFLTGDLVLRPERERWGLRPYGFLGVGVKRYAFGEEEPRDPLDFTKPMDGTGGMIRYGVGVEARILGRTVAPELGGSFSRYVLVDDERGSRRAHPQRELTLSVRIHLCPFGEGR